MLEDNPLYLLPCVSQFGIPTRSLTKLPSRLDSESAIEHNHLVGSRLGCGVQLIQSVVGDKRVKDLGSDVNSPFVALHTNCRLLYHRAGHPNLLKTSLRILNEEGPTICYIRIQPYVARAYRVARGSHFINFNISESKPIQYVL